MGPQRLHALRRAGDSWGSLWAPRSAPGPAPCPQALRVSMEEQRQRQEEEARRAAAASAAEAGIAATGGDGERLGWGGGMCEGRGAAPAPWEAGAGCGTALHSSAAAGVPCGRQPLPRMLGRARAGASSAAATTPWGLGGGREGFGAAPGGLVLGCESGLCVRRFGRCPAEDDHHPAGVRPRRAARPEQHDGGGADRLRHADVAAGGR